MITQATFSRAAGLWLAALTFSAQVGCDEKKTPPPRATPPEAAEEAEPVLAVRSGPLELSVDDVSPRVGFERAVVQKPDGKPHPEGLELLRQKLEAAKDQIAGRGVVVTVHRQAVPGWVSTYINELGKLAPTSIEVQTDTRPDFPSKLKVASETELESPPECSLVGMILADRGTAIWRFSGGTARKRGRGMGGPDLTMTADTISSMAKGCTESTLFFATAAEGVEWGLVYDLAASALSLEKAGLTRAVFPSKPAVAGHRVDLRK